MNNIERFNRTARVHKTRLANDKIIARRRGNAASTPPRPPMPAPPTPSELAVLSLPASMGKDLIAALDNTRYPDEATRKIALLVGIQLETIGLYAVGGVE